MGLYAPSSMTSGTESRFSFATESERCMIAMKRIACPSCSAGLKVPETLPAGKQIKCPRCGTSFPVSAANGVAAIARKPAALDDDERDELEERPPVKKRKPAPPVDDDDDVPERPAKVRRRVDDDDDDERPASVRRRVDDDDEDEDERPVVRKKFRKKKPQPASKAPLVIGIVIVAVLLLGGGAVGAYFAFGKKSEVADKGSTKPAQGSGAEDRRGRPEADAGDRMAEGPRGGREGRGPRGGNPEGGGERQPSGGERRPSGGGSQEASSSSSGLEVFNAMCVRCHSGGGGGRQRAPDLSKVGADPSHTTDWLTRFIKNPRSVKQNSRMQGFEGRISDADLRVLVDYLVTLK